MFDLVDITGVPHKWQSKHPIKALKFQGSSDQEVPVIRALKYWKKCDAEEYEGLIQGLRKCGSAERFVDNNIVKQIRPGIYEIRAVSVRDNDDANANPYVDKPQTATLKARLFFFYHWNSDGREEIIICTNACAKDPIPNEPSLESDQNTAILRCEKLMQLYLQNEA